MFAEVSCFGVDSQARGTGASENQFGIFYIKKNKNVFFVLFMFITINNICLYMFFIYKLGLAYVFLFSFVYIIFLFLTNI